jgi:hypothetical protein
MHICDLGRQGTFLDALFFCTLPVSDEFEPFSSEALYFLRICAHPPQVHINTILPCACAGRFVIHAQPLALFYPCARPVQANMCGAQGKPHTVVTLSESVVLLVSIHSQHGSSTSAKEVLRPTGYEPAGR